MCSLQQNYDVNQNWERFETGSLTVAIKLSMAQFGHPRIGDLKLNGLYFM